MQPKLFEKTNETVEVENVLLYALGDFQSRGKILANRELALDRLRGAFLRAFTKFGIPELSDNRIAECLQNLGVKVKEVPAFVAKHPYRVTVPNWIVRKSVKIFLSKVQNQV